MPPGTPVQGPEDNNEVLFLRELHLTLAPHFLGASFGLPESSASVLRTEVLLTSGGLLPSVAMNPLERTLDGLKVSRDGPCKVGEHGEE